MANLKLRSTTSATDPGSTSAKGSALTHTEMDSNFILLNNEKLENTTDDFVGELSIKGSGGSARGSVRLYDNDDSAYVDLKANATITSQYTFTLPPEPGTSGFVLKTNGSGDTFWAADASGTTADSTTTFTNKTFDLTDNTLTGTTAEFNTALSDNDFATLAGTETLTNKTLTSPVIDTIVTVSNGHITIDPNGTGQVRLGTAEAEQYAGGNGGLIIHDQSQGSYTDIPAAGANYGAIYGTGIQVENTGGAGTPLLLWANKTNSGYPNLWAHRSRDDGAGNRDFLDNDDMVFTFFAAGWDGSTTEAYGYGSFTQTAAVEMKAAEDHSGSAQGGKIVFKTINNGGTTSSTKLTLDDNIEANVPFVLKHYTTTERNALTAVEGSIIYNSTDNKAQVYNGTSWVDLH